MLFNLNCEKSKNLKDFKCLKDENLKRLVIGQLSRCRFEINGFKCIVKVKNEETEELVYFTKKMGVSEFMVEIENYLKPNAVVEEPSLKFLFDKLDKEVTEQAAELAKKNNHELKIWDEAKKRVKLFDFLKMYKQNYYKLGSEIKGIILCKVYSEKPELLNEHFREMYGAKWIDYEKQLATTGDIISDDGLCGLWSTEAELFEQNIDNLNKDWFGDKVFILVPIDECHYFISDKEVVGNQYKVKCKLSLKCTDFNKKLYNAIKKVENDLNNHS